ncbi:hypothetical protein BR93DRAFT_965560 [Coniochaeta sp. PMI_546]|nr:hypothetical protein BR93DRAFT_965560 [Coniochaeta sp. PMI_546]
MIFDRKYPTYRVSVFPIDDQAKELLHTEHMCLGSLPHGKEMVHLLLLQKRGNVKIMEVGAGLCLWVQSVASHLPDATIIATEIFDFEISIPNNVSVYLADVNDGLPFPRHELDYIHVRGQVGRIKGWQEFITDTFTQLAPGGYLEYYDISWEFIRARRVSELPDPWVECSQILSHVASYTGRTFHVSMDECKGWMQAAGYTIYHDNCYDISLAKSTAVRRMIINKIIGIYTFHHFMERWQLSEHRARIRMLERELENNCHNVVVQAVRVVGKKPGGEQQELVLQT